jgi:iron complex outermembrane receptor protein
MSESRDSALIVALIGALLSSPVAAPIALAQDGAEAIEEVVVVGSRRAGRTATDSPVPVDVVTGDDFENQGTSDMDELLRNLLPSYNVSNNSIDDAATLIRPANLRGLPADNTLVLVNGKRMHRASVIAELGGSLNAGSQGPDVGVIPTQALASVEILRDGAAAQYGSDAIAGVINYRLKENNSGFTIEGKYGEFYEGDGDTKQIGMNLGVPLGPDGFGNFTLQWKEKDATSRSLQRTDAQALIDTGNLEVGNPAQVWGSPELKDDWAFMWNTGIDLTDSQELYLFGNYAERKTTGGFFFRNPNSRGGVFTTDYDDPTLGEISIRAIMDTNLRGESGVTSNCPRLISPGGTPTDQDAVDVDRAALAALPDNCIVANNLYPGGYTPSFGGELEDISVVAGIRGEMANGLFYDFSANLGRNESAYNIVNTWNPSLGPQDSQTAFELGTYTQTDQSYNADFVYPVAVDAFYSDLNVAFGAEYRVETFGVKIGEEASWQAGDYAFQSANFHDDGTTPLVAMSIGAHGFAGFSPRQAGEWSRSNWAIYTDMEADVVESLTLGFALRYEDFTDFGDTLNGKLAGRWSITDNFALRGSVSTGFRAPTPGQANVTKVSTVTDDDGELIQSGQIPPTNPVAMLVGGTELKEETAVNYTLGAAWDATDNLTFTLDFFQIELEDRIAGSGQIDIADEDAPSGIGCDGLSVPACLEVLGVPGASDLSSIRYYTNEFDTTTRGVDLVGTYVTDWGDAGITNWSLAWNYTETEVDRVGEWISRNRLVELENYNPENRVVFTANHMIGNFRFLFRANMYDDWVDANLGDFDAGDGSGDASHTPGFTDYSIACDAGDFCYNGKWVFDMEAAYTFNDRYTVVVGGMNIFDQGGAKDGNNSAGPDFSDNSGQKYSESTHWGINGGFWYLRFRADLM